MRRRAGQEDMAVVERWPLVEVPLYFCISIAVFHCISIATGKCVFGLAAVICIMAGATTKMSL